MRSRKCAGTSSAWSSGAPVATRTWVAGALSAVNAQEAGAGSGTPAWLTPRSDGGFPETVTFPSSPVRRAATSAVRTLARSRAVSSKEEHRSLKPGCGVSGSSRRTMTVTAARFTRQKVSAAWLDGAHVSAPARDGASHSHLHMSVGAGYAVALRYRETAKNLLREYANR